MNTDSPAGWAALVRPLRGVFPNRPRQADGTEWAPVGRPLVYR